MKRYGYVIGASGLMLALSTLPLAAFAERGSANAEGSVGASVGIQNVTVAASGTVQGTVRGGEDEDTNDEATSSEDRATSAQGPSRASDEAREHSQSFLFRLEGTTSPAFSLAQLKQSIERRHKELDQDEDNASTSPKIRRVVEHMNPVRLAVHTLLASKELLGGIGPQVSEIAKHMNDSLATTTQAELAIESRGFLSRLLFGGDRRSAEAISEAVAKNQERINTLTGLLGQASTTPEVKATIEAQISAFQDAQAKLQAAADAEAKAWGLFSWRF